MNPPDDTPVPFTPDEAWLSELRKLSLKEKLGVCRTAASAAVGCLRTLVHRTDPEDAALRGLFKDLARAEEGRLREIERYDARTEAPSILGERARHGLVCGILPSLSKLPGGRFIGREAGTYLAECLAEESSCLYRALADQAMDEESRAFFLRSREEDASALAFLRKVLL